MRAMLVAFLVFNILVISVQVPPVYEKLKISEYVNIENKIDKILERKVGHLQQIMRRFQQVVVLSANKAQKEDYIANPLAANVLVRRLSEDWTSLVALAGGQSVLSSFGIGRVRWPNAQDVDATCKSLERIQSCYYLRTEELAQGILANSAVSANFTAADCFNMGRYYYSSVHHTEAVQWLQEALRKIRNGDNSANALDVIYYLSPSLCFSGDIKGSVTGLQMIQRFHRFLSQAELIVEDYQKMAMVNCKSLQSLFMERKEEILFEQLENGSSEVHKRLCQAPSSLQDGLRCRYAHYQKPHLRFQPFKLEELQLDPLVLRFYDSISDHESLILKERAMTKMEMAKIKTYDGQAESSDYRRSHVAWLYDVDAKPSVAEVTRRLTRRIADMTQLDMTQAEGYQLSRYSVGGEFLPHLDCINGVPHERNRLATLMFYLNDVKQGGNTVFLQWGLSVPPVKNSALLWFHFLPNGDIDRTTEHSGCPVLEGSKWVINKWIKNGGNEFQMPCGLTKESSFKKYYSQS